MKGPLLAASWRAIGCGILVAVTEPRALGPARAAVEAELAAVDLACSRFREDSEVSALNRSGGEWVTVSPLLLHHLRTARWAARVTGGAVDPTVARALVAAGYDRTFREVAADGTAVEAVPAAGWRRLQIDIRRRRVRLLEGAQVDLGSTAKALTADRAARKAVIAGACGVLVSLGGDVALGGPPPDDGWIVRVLESPDPSSPGTAVKLAIGGLATSGTTVRRWRRGGSEIHHIIDPRTGLSASSPWKVVSVAAASCLDANVASTAAFVLAEKAPAWLRARRLPSRLVRKDGSVLTIADWPQEAVAA